MKSEIESWLGDASKLIQELSTKINLLEREIVCIKRGKKVDDEDGLLTKIGQVWEEKLRTQNVLVISGIDEEGDDVNSRLKNDYRQVDQLLMSLQLHRTDLVQQKRLKFSPKSKSKIVIWLQDSVVANRALQIFHANRDLFDHVYISRLKTTSEQNHYKKLVDERNVRNSFLPIDLTTGKRCGIDNGRKYVWGVSNFRLVRKYF